MNYYISYQIITKSGIILSDSKGDPNTVETRTYIPGSTVRGSLAAQFIQQNNLGKTAHKDSEFFDYFLSGKLKFIPAYPVEADNLEKTYYPTPLSIVRDKKPSKKAYNMMAENVRLPLSHKSPQEYISFSDQHATFHQPETRIQFHHAREDRVKGRSDSGSIFNYESLEPHQHFHGMITGSKEILQQFRKGVRQETFTLFLGRSKTAEYGECEFTWITMTPEPLEVAGENGSGGMTVEFISPVIIPNEYGYPVISASVLEKYLNGWLQDNGSGNCTVKVGKIFARAEAEETFVGVWKNRQPLQWSYKPGTTVQLELNNPGTDTRQQFEALGYQGIGRRTTEGFGQFRLLPADLDGEIQVTSSKKSSGDKPKEPVPGVVKELFISQINRRYIEFIRQKASERANSFRIDKRDRPFLRKLFTKFQEASTQHEVQRWLDEFTGENAPDTRRYLLQSVRSKSGTLEDLLSSNLEQIIPEAVSHHVNDLFDQALMDLCQTIDFSPVSDTEEHFARYQQFWLTFLETLILK